MKILHYSDRSDPQFADLYKQCDVLITTGDLNLSDFVGLEHTSDKKIAFGVYGNHDSGNYLESLGIINVHNKIFEYDGLRWGGFQGSIKYTPSGIMYTEDEAKQWADTFPVVDVLLLHAGPLGMLDDPSDPVQIGNLDIRRYILEKKPKFVFIGHQSSDDQMEVGQTKLFRTFGARLIEVSLG